LNGYPPNTFPLRGGGAAVVGASSPIEQPIAIQTKQGIRNSAKQKSNKWTSSTAPKAGASRSDISE